MCCCIYNFKKMLRNLERRGGGTPTTTESIASAPKLAAFEDVRSFNNSDLQFSLSTIVS